MSVYHPASLYYIFDMT